MNSFPPFLCRCSVERRRGRGKESSCNIAWPAYNVQMGGIFGVVVGLSLRKTLELSCCCVNCCCCRVFVGI